MTRQRESWQVNVRKSAAKKIERVRVVGKRKYTQTEDLGIDKARHGQIALSVDGA